jgi:hypothetical protein
VDISEMRSQKKTKFIFKLDQFRASGGEELGSRNVFEWVTKILHCMEEFNVHPHTMASAIYKGEFMSPARKTEIKAERAINSNRYFLPVADKEDMVASVRWLETLLIYIMVNMGRSEILLDAAAELKKLRIETKSVIGGYILFSKVLELLSRFTGTRFVTFLDPQVTICVTFSVPSADFQEILCNICTIFLHVAKYCTILC